MVEIFSFYLEYDNYSDKFNYKERGRVTIIRYYSCFASFLWLLALFLGAEVHHSINLKK